MHEPYAQVSNFVLGFWKRVWLQRRTSGRTRVPGTGFDGLQRDDSRLQKRNVKWRRSLHGGRRARLSERGTAARLESYSPFDSRWRDRCSESNLREDGWSPS